MPIAKSSGSYGGYSVKYRSFLIKYAEIGVKGKNRYLFEDALVKQIHHRLKNLEGNFSVTKEAGRIYAEAAEDFDYDEVIDALQHVFGIVGICPMVQIEDNGYEDLKAQVVKYIDDAYENKNFTFKVVARRANKQYPVVSDQINRDLGEVILNADRNSGTRHVIIIRRNRQPGCRLDDRKARRDHRCDLFPCAAVHERARKTEGC